MSPSHVRKIKLRAEHVDCYRRLRASTLMKLFQEMCVEHTEMLGMGREKTLDKGLLWVVNAETAVINRWPEYGEEITLECHPGRTLHYFFPRAMTVTGGGGETLIRVGAMWSLIERASRRMADPSEHGVFIDGEEREGDLQPKMSIPARETPFSASFRADYSLVDLNGHMNNAAYIDKCMDLPDPRDFCKTPVKELNCLFKRELALGEDCFLKYGVDGGVYHFSCDNFIIELSK